MAKKKKQNKNWHWPDNVWHWLASAVIAVMLLFVLQAYLLPAEAVMGKKVLEVLPLPAGFVNTDAILLGDYYARISVAERALRVNELDASQKEAIYNRLVLNAIAKRSAGNKGIDESGKEIDDSYDFEEKVTGKNNLAGIYGLSDSEFKKFIIQPDLFNAKLAVWLAGNRNINVEAYKKLGLVMSKLGAGFAFDNAAIAYSEDPASAQIGGEMGFVTFKDLPPELFNALSGIKDRKPHPLISRYGIHIVEVLGEDQKGPLNSARYHIKQIFIKTADFDQWLASQKQNYTVLRLVHF